MPYSPNYAAGDVLTAAAMNSIGEAWTVYFSAWASTGTAPTIGNGICAGSYCIVNKVAFVTIAFAAGTTSTYGTGVYRFSTPTGYDIRTSSMPADTPLGTAMIFEQVGGTRYPGVVSVYDSNEVKIQIGGEIAYVQAFDFGQGTPLTWSNSGTIKRPTMRCTFMYEVA